MTWRYFTVLSVAALLAACGPRQSAGPLFPGSVRGAPLVAHQRLLGRFTHVVILVQENRTVDNLFNGFPGADTVRTAMRNGQTVALRRTPLQPEMTSHDLDHGHNGFVQDYNGGFMDGFDHEFKTHSEGTAYRYVDFGDLHNYWTLATRFTLADEVFQANMGPSFAAHIADIAAQTGYPFAVANNPNSNGGPAGCFGTDQVGYIDVRTPFPGEASKGPACVEIPTIFDLLDANGLSWRYYAPNHGIGIHYWSGPDYIRHLALGPDQANMFSPETLVLSDIASGNLPAVSYVIPESCTSDHPWQHTLFKRGGPKWIAAVTNAIGASQYWDSTLILVTWDDWGVWFDHVPPPILNSDQVGFRVPLLIVSAYPANPGVPDHTMRNQASIITAIESIFGLGSLGQLDAETDDLSNDFSFGSPVHYGAPLASATPPPAQECGAGQAD